MVALEAVKSGLIQVLMFSVNPCYDLQPASENCEELWDEKNYQGQLLNMDAVSYTHLDVYKRQAMSRSELSIAVRVPRWRFKEKNQIL